MKSKMSYFLLVVFFAGLMYLNNVHSVIYDVCEAMSDEDASYDDFQALIEAIYNDQCNEAINVKTTFSMSKEEFGLLARNYDIVDKDGNALVFFRSGTPSPIGAGAILVYGHDGDFPVKKGDKLHIWTSGMPKDIMIEVAIEACDPYDDVCDAACAYEDDHVCDPKCYTNARDNVMCDIDCVDINGNRVIDSGDIDGICDPDCYNNDDDPKRAYDPDCVKTAEDGICDPDSSGIIDGVCDSDCALPINNNITCDFDCNGTTYAGNPGRLKDEDCFVCDGQCNGFCSPDCSFLDNDPDCPGGFIDFDTLAECCGNDECGIGENCEVCNADCPANMSISGIVGTPCECTLECNGAAGLVCNGPIGNEHCCPNGQKWNGTQCVIINYFNIVFVPIGWGTSSSDYYNYKAIADTALNDFMAKSPFSECPYPEENVKVHYIDVSDCQETCTDHCTDCIIKARACVLNNAALAGIYNRFVAITKGISGPVGGCASGIPGDGVSVSDTWPEATTHELGHTLGLGHVDCDVPCHACMVTPNNPNCLDCSYTPADDKKYFIMDYCSPMDHFGPNGYNHLKSSALSTWLTGC
ncbi:MAG: hypothetical protein ABIG84_07385 [archaeon]